MRREMRGAPASVSTSKRHDQFFSKLLWGCKSVPLLQILRFFSTDADTSGLYYVGVLAGGPAQRLICQHQAKSPCDSQHELILISVTYPETSLQGPSCSISCRFWWSVSFKELVDYFILLSSGSPSHTAAVIAAIVFLLLLALAAVVYCRCHLNIKLWYRNSYGDYELNGGTYIQATEAFPTSWLSDFSSDATAVFVCPCLQMANCMTPTSPMWTTTMTGSLSTLFSNLTWRIKMRISCTLMRMISCLAQVRFLELKWVYADFVALIIIF